ncbi:MAG: hypothetical protein WB662_00810 [Methyloceanibacter sp.]
MGIPKNQLVYFPKGDLTKGKLVCEASRMTPATSASTSGTGLGLECHW